MLKEIREKKKKLLLVLLLGVVLMFIFFPRTTELQAFVAGDSLPEGRHASEILQLMQEAVDEDQITVQINTVIDFETPTSYGNIGIINPSINIFPIAVDFVLDETGEVIFRSGGIQPNEFIASAPLDVALPIGVHQATAIFNAYDPETLEHVWESNVFLTINVGQ